MNEPTGRDRIQYDIHLTPGAIRQVKSFGHAAGIESFTESVEAMIAVAALQGFPCRLPLAIKVQEALSYKR